jgi:hypothetical protein
MTDLAIRMRDQVTSLTPVLTLAREKLEHYRKATGARPVDGLEHEYVIRCIDEALQNAAAELAAAKQPT